MAPFRARWLRLGNFDRAHGSVIPAQLNEKHREHHRFSQTRVAGTSPRVSCPWRRSGHRSDRTAVLVRERTDASAVGDGDRAADRGMIAATAPSTFSIAAS